ncbi:hypothetical protein ACH34Q_21065 [Actinomadura sp. 9N407]
MGTALPADYAEFIDTYGSCEIGEYLVIADPRDPPHHQLWSELGDQYRAMRKQFPESSPLAAWPEQGESSGWGIDIDGNRFGWLTQGEPDRWPTAVWGLGSGAGN